MSNQDSTDASNTHSADALNTNSTDALDARTLHGPADPRLSPPADTTIPASNPTPIIAPNPLTTAFLSTLSKHELKQLKSQYYLGPGDDWTKEIWDIARPVRLIYDARKPRQLTYMTKQKVAAWYPYRYARLTKADMDMAKLASLSQQFASLTGLYLEKPRMPQPIQEYTRRYWPTHISAIFEEEWKAKCAKLKAEGKEVPTKIGVHERNAVVRRLWQTETQAFRDAIKADVEETYQEKMKEYEEKMKNIPQLGKQYTWCV